MTDTNQTPAKDPREAIAKRMWIDDNRTEVAEELATGVAYEFIGRTKAGITVPPDGQAYYMFFRDLTPAALNMLAGFGGLTLMGNVTNTWLGTKAGDRTAKACEAIAARVQGLNDGQWADRTRTGFQLDFDTLADAMADIGRTTGHWAEADLDAKKAEARAKMDSNPDWAKKVYSNDAVKTAYARLRGQTIMTIDDVFAA